MPLNLSRRQLLKVLGLAGAGVTLSTMDGLGKSVLAAPDTFADSKPNEVPRKYWWVKTVDKPTTEIDWQAMKRFSEWKSTRGSLQEYRGEEEHAKYLQLQKDNLLKWELEGKPGYTTKDIALNAAVGFGRPAIQFMGPQKALTPEERGVPRYEGTPEENSRIITAALRHMGAGTVGFVELDPETTRKLVYAEEPAPSKRPIFLKMWM